MSRPTRPAARLAAAALLAAALVAAGRSPARQKQPTDEDVRKLLDRAVAADRYRLPYDAKRAEKVRAERLEWHRAGTVGVFDKSDRSKAPWAAKARAALDLAARKSARHELSGAGEALAAASQVAAQEALAAGCDDPLVRYFIEYARSRVGKPDPKQVAKLRDAAEAVYRSGYSDFRKMYAAHNVFVALHGVPADDPLRRELGAWTDRFWELFERVAGEGRPSSDAGVLEMAQLHETYLTGGGRTRRQNFEESLRHLEKGKAGAACRLLAEGRFLIHEGWDARGKGLGPTVTPEGARVFEQRLGEAREKLAAAWEADKNRGEAAAEMITVCKALGDDRAAMEEWFARAMAANPDNRAACVAKLDYLHPKWRGTSDEYFAFGWAVATAENVEGMIPHAAFTQFTWNMPIAGPMYAKEPARFAKYYSQPVVWQTMHTALERLTAAGQDNPAYRTLDARFACLAGRWDVAHRQFERLGAGYVRSYFPDPAEYARFVEQAKQAAGDKK